jgi:hypothetical protein
LTINPHLLEHFMKDMLNMSAHWASSCIERHPNKDSKGGFVVFRMSVRCCLFPVLSIAIIL